VTGDDVRAAAELCRQALEPALGADWSAPVPNLDFTVAGVVGHASQATLWYSVDMWSGPENASFEVKIADDTGNRRLLASLLGGAQVLAAALDAAPPSLRGFHPFGSPDPAGFAAMGCDELLVHGRDAASGLGREFGEDAGLASSILARLFPWHSLEAGDDPWQVLLWANGRVSLPGRADQRRWGWHCAPLAEWDGAAPAVRR
jgi:uncharacterized protein (TIGR03083 family)